MLNSSGLVTPDVLDVHWDGQMLHKDSCSGDKNGNYRDNHKYITKLIGVAGITFAFYFFGSGHVIADKPTSDSAAIEWVDSGNSPFDVDGYIGFAQSMGLSSDEISEGLNALEWMSWRYSPREEQLHPMFSVGRAGTFVGNGATLIQNFGGDNQPYEDDLNELLNKAIYKDHSLTLDETVKLNKLLAKSGINTVFVPFGLTMSDILKVLYGSATVDEINSYKAQMRENSVRASRSGVDTYIPLHPEFAVGTAGTFVGSSAIVIQNFDGNDPHFPPSLNDLLRRAVFSEDNLGMGDALRLNLLLRNAGMNVVFVPNGSTLEDINNALEIAILPKSEMGNMDNN